MSRGSKRAADIGLAAISIEGGLIAPEQVVAIASATADQKLAAEYGCPKGTTLRDEITRYFRIGQAHWASWSTTAEPTATQTATFAKALLEDSFGFVLAGPVDHERDGRRFCIAWEAKGGRVPVVVAAPVIEGGRLGEGFNRAIPEFGDGPHGRIARRSPAVLLQDWLNANPDFYWGLVFAGDRVRLMRDNASFTRPAYIEADLGAIFRDEMFADFTALWLLIHSSRFGAENASPSDCALERWREAGMRAGTAARERLRGNVKGALLELGQGFLDANTALRERLDDGSLSMPVFFEQLLRIIYRLIFLGVAEDRDLLHAPGVSREVKNLYAGNYGFAYLRDRSARRSAHDHHHDAWEGIKIVFKALDSGEKQLGLPALGSLFARGQTPELNSSQLSNRAFLRASFKLAWLIEEGRRVRINWRDMATEELGSVYEGLLELVPARENGGRTFTFAGGAQTRGHARKLSGSYYTPDSLVQCLMDSALDPQLERAEAAGGVEAILDLKVIDPACGSGHFLLGAARRMATRVAQRRNPDAPDYNAALRDVVGNCIYGVDRNPMAVELAKVALWIESVSPGQPLGFLDANIRCGDALLGVFNLEVLEQGIPEGAYKPLTGDRKEAAAFYKKKNKDERKGQGRFDFEIGTGAMPPKKLAANLATIRRMSEDTVGQVEKKREAFEAWRRDPARWNTKVACDLYTAAFLLPKTEVPENYQRSAVPTTADIWKKLGGGALYGPLEAAALDAAEAARAFHWPLAFPDVLIAKGGFDVVLGNPPWEVVQLSEKEYFESRVPEIAELKGAARKRAIAQLETQHPEIYAQFARDKREFDAMNEFSRASGRFDLTARGKVNTYGLFADLFLAATGEKGSAGLIVPTGIATDATTAPFFGHLVEAKRLSRLFDFENRERLFQDVDSRMKFCLLTLGSDVVEAEFAFFLTDPTQLEDSRRRFTLSPHQIKRLNPNTENAPIFRSRKDAELTASIYDRVPVLFNERTATGNGEGNPWGLEFRQGLFNMTSDSGLFSGSEVQADTVPLYEAKMIHQFDHRWATYEGNDESRDTTTEEKADPRFEPSPRYRVSKLEVDVRLAEKSWRREWLLGWRDITNATNERTTIASVFPRVACGDTLLLMFPSIVDQRLIAALLANLCSFTQDYASRQKIGGTHMKYNVFKQLAVFPPTAYAEADLAFIVPRVLELSFTSHSMTPFARDLGHEGPPFNWDEDRRAQLRAELDAWYALAYGLTRDELRYVLDPKDVMGTDYPSETFRVLQKNEIAKYNEYRTRRLVLAAYDKLVAEGMRPRTEGYR